MDQVFISYSSHDRGFVEQLTKDLRGNGLSPWFDRGEMFPGDSLIDKIGEAILQNGLFIVVLSQSSVESEWVKRELALALTVEFKRKAVKVIPILLQDCEIPAFLRDKVYADFRTSYRSGLGDLLRALQRGIVGRSPASSVPEGGAKGLIWDNVQGDNVTASNIRQ